MKPLTIALLSVVWLSACSPEARWVPVICTSRDVPSALPAMGMLELKVWGPIGPTVDAWQSFVVEAQPDRVVLEVCSADAYEDWHLAGIWHLDTPAPVNVGTYPPGSYFEGELKGKLSTDSPFVYSVFETVGIEAVAIPGEGIVTVYDPVSGTFAGELFVESIPSPGSTAGMRLNWDLSWTP